MVLTGILGVPPVADPNEETFVLFSQYTPDQSLGFIDPQASTLEISVAGHDLTILQSRGLLTSDRKEGTTGAVVWKVTPLFAQWISSPSNFFFTNGLLSSSSNVLELGAGVSGIVALSLGPLVASYIATDQPYVLKLLRQNITSNLATVLPKPRRTTTNTKHSSKSKSTPAPLPTVTAAELDWETTDTSHLRQPDVIIACDCIYNEALIEPLNSTCAALSGPQTLVVVAQQLRDSDVFEAWLASFMRFFRVWQVPDGMVGEGLRGGRGFVVHVGVLRGREEEDGG